MNLYEILKRLESVYRPNKDEYIVLHMISKDNQINHFEILIGIVLSQNTSDRNAMRALNNLRRDLDGIIEPERVLRTPVETIINAIRVAGIAKRRAETIYELAKWFKSNEDIVSKLPMLDVDEARKILMQIRGVGPKTADVYLLAVLRKPTFPIDAHIRRVLTRMGLALENEGYENIRKRVVSETHNDVDVLMKLHILLIEHGRKVCRARKPLCNECALRDLCSYYKKADLGK
ncbi:MAG: endonuclease III [Ignisphaera sp.]